jgi:hypothetical protein
MTAAIRQVRRLPQERGTTVSKERGALMESRIIAVVAALVGGIETLSILMLLCRV